MNKKIKSALKIIIFFSIGIGLFYLAYRGQDFSVLWQEIKSIKWSWIVLSIIFGVVGHYSRALRWSLMLEPLGYKPKNVNLFSSVMIMYLSNMAIPRSGEFVRCGIINRYEKIPFSQSLGTVITERIADMTFFLILTVIVFLTQSGVIMNFLNDNPQIMSRIESFEKYIPLIIAVCVALMAAGFFAVKYAIKKNLFSLGEKINSVIKNFKEGIFTIMKMKKKWQFLAHTFFINFVYFLDTYLPFQAFSCTENVSASDALTVFVLGTYGVVVPSPGGMGTWHFLTIELLALYGITRDPCGRAYAFVTHGAQDVTFLIGGFLMLILLPVINKNYKNAA